MNLIQEQEKENKDAKVKKIVKIALIVSVILFIIVLAVMIYLTYQDSKQLKMYIDKTKKPISTGLFITDENSGKTYISIQDIAKLVNYDFYNGDYSKLTEEQNKCYLNNKKEVAGFELGSNQLYKADPNVTNQDYEWYTLDEPVRRVDGKLYATSTAIQKACNITFNYDKEKNRIEILTLPYLVSSYETISINNYGYAGLDTEFKNQKAILQNMLVVRKQEAKDKFKYGVVSATEGKQIIGTKYDKIEYIEVANDFYVTTDKKVGVMSSEGAQKIEPSYDTIKVLDNDLRLYLVKINNLYGVLDRNGKRVLYLEYNQIGVDTSLFPRNNIKNSMLLFENCIPVMKNGKWGIFDKNGNVLADVVYDSLGYINSTKKDASINNLLVIPSVEGIVICRDGKYGIINSVGKAIAPCAFSRIYSITNLGEDKYYLDYINDQTGETVTLEVDEYVRTYSNVNEPTSGQIDQIQTVDQRQTDTENSVDTNVIDQTATQQTQQTTTQDTQLINPNVSL